MTLGNAAAARVRLIVWCKGCQRQIEPDPAEMAQRYGAETPVPYWRERLVCSRCSSRQVDMVARVKCARNPLLPPRPVHSSGPSVGEGSFRCLSMAFWRSVAFWQTLVAPMTRIPSGTWSYGRP